MLELEGYSVLTAAAVSEALEIGKHAIIDCAVLDHERDDIVLAQKIARRHPSLPIMLISDRPEIPELVYSSVEMLITREEAIQELPDCVQELLNRCGCRYVDGHLIGSNLRVPYASPPLHSAMVRWLLPWWDR